jgi:hypothetical protein
MNIKNNSQVIESGRALLKIKASMKELEKAKEEHTTAMKTYFRNRTTHKIEFDTTHYALYKEFDKVSLSKKNITDQEDIKAYNLLVERYGNTSHVESIDVR